MSPLKQRKKRQTPIKVDSSEITIINLSVLPCLPMPPNPCKKEKYPHNHPLASVVPAVLCPALTMLYLHPHCKMVIIQKAHLHRTNSSTDLSQNTIKTTGRALGKNPFRR